MTLSQAHDSSKIWITKPDQSEPEMGLFSIKLGKGQLPRGLAVLKISGMWSVYLDGKLAAQPSGIWTQAFGRLYEGRNYELTGMRIDRAQYNQIVKARQRDFANGLDLDSPQNISQVRIP